MPGTMRLRWGGLWLALLLAAAPAAGQARFSLPVELTDGLAVSGSPPHPFTASLRLHPTLGLDRRGTFQAALTGAAVFTNPEVAFLGGGRLTARIAQFQYSILPLASIRLAAEGLAGTRARSRVGGGVILDVGGGLVQLTLRAARDVRQDVTFAEGGLGLDLWLLFGPKGEPDPFD